MNAPTPLDIAQRMAALLLVAGAIAGSPAAASDAAASSASSAAAASSPGVPAAAASAPAWVALNRRAGQQARAGDFAGLHDTLTALAPMMPGSPTVVYNLAASAARTGHPDEALAQLARLADAGLVYDLGADEDFASLAGNEAFEALRERLRRNARAIGTPRRLAPIARADSLPEALAWDAPTRRLFVSGVRHCEIRAIDDPRRRGARERPFARLPAPVFALAVDGARRRLWATIAVVVQGDGCGEHPRETGRTALLALDLRSGRILQRIDSGLPGVLGDLLVAGDGTVFVSESLHGAVLRLARGADVLERIDPPGEFVSPQAPVLAADGRTLLVPDYARGIAALDLGTRPATLRWLPNGRAVFSAGIDGLVPDGDGGFIAIQNGLAPPRVLRLSADLARQEVLESGTPGLGEPTHGIVVGRSLWFVADVGWDRLAEDGRVKPGAAPARPELRAIGLR